MSLTGVSVSIHRGELTERRKVLPGAHESVDQGHAKPVSEDERDQLDW